MSTIPFTHTFFYEKYQSNRLVEGHTRYKDKGVPPTSFLPKLFEKSFTKNFFYAIAKIRS